MRQARSTLAVCVSILAAGGMITAGGMWAIAGPLNPPAGAVAPTYKTLSEVEPRTAIGAATTPGNATAIYRITQPGSYYLTGNVGASGSRHAIEVVASNVTIDLGGYTLDGTGATGLARGISVTSTSNDVLVRNGQVVSWTSNGIVATGTGTRFEDLALSSNGLSGILVGSNALVTRCVSHNNTSHGFQCTGNATFSDCIARDNVDHGFNTANGSTLRGCSARANGDIGINAGAGSVVEGCSAISNQTGIAVGAGAMVSGCTAYDNNVDGITATSNCMITECNAALNGNSTTAGAGIRATGTRCRIESNNVTTNYYGIHAQAGNCFIVRNTAGANSGSNYELSGTNTAGLIITTPGPGFVSSNAWANFSY